MLVELKRIRKVPAVGDSEYGLIQYHKPEAHER
jgi:hypothetical protein